MNKKAFCYIKFNGYQFYKFFKALSSIIYEVELNISENGLYILTMDPLRIAILEVQIYNDSFKFFKSGKIGINLDDFKKSLKCKDSDNCETEIIFGEKQIYLSIDSKKYNSSIKRTLNNIGYSESSDIDINFLKKSNFPCFFKIRINKLNYLIENFGLYSEIITIKCFKDNITFSEHNNKKKNKIIWKKGMIQEYLIKFDEMNPINKEDRNHEYFMKGDYSLDFFKVNNKMAKILGENSFIEFYLKNNFPLKSKLKFENLGNTSINFFISPRN